MVKFRVDNDPQGQCYLPKAVREESGPHEAINHNGKPAVLVKNGSRFELAESSMNEERTLSPKEANEIPCEICIWTKSEICPQVLATFLRTLSRLATLPYAKKEKRIKILELTGLESGNAAQEA